MIANATEGTTVVLFTDSQVPELDNTFPIISNHSFPVQAWMMALSDAHYGNPFSTVDIVVYFWRVGLLKQKSSSLSSNKYNAVSMFPKECYKPTRENIWETQ